jgi:hypothetical protein
MSVPTGVRVGLIAAVIVLLAGCAGSAATSAPSPVLIAPPTPTPVGSAVESIAPALPSITAATATASDSAAPTVAESPTEAPAASPTPSSAAVSTPAPVPSFVLPSFTSDKELEAALPDTFQGTTLKKFSFKGGDLFKNATGSSKEFLNLITSLGKTPDDLSFAVASDPTGKLGVTFGAYRIKGADASVWFPRLVEIAKRQDSTSQVSQLNLGGKDVTSLTTSAAKQITYGWPRGDVLFIVLSADKALAGQAIAAMP